MKSSVLSLWFVSTLACAQSVPTEFPQQAAPMAPQALTAALAGKVYSVKPAKGPDWRWQFKADGYFFINVGNFSDSGKWSVKDSALCSEGRYIKASCNEVRVDGHDLYLKRDSGEVVKMTVQ
ncbi:MAG: hypothetical protein KGL18_20180 [Burkholderiales bacterium]|nr:hypothetical protein [Burkholderiales bacterium]MDE1927138.1 hypothetical protein [Burkholderiales bacterium]MDE2505287.1 hypothetical protein [Burkholderiales bacterium]